MCSQQANPLARSLACAAIATVVGAQCACSSKPSPTAAPRANAPPPPPAAQVEISRYERDETRSLVVLVDDAARSIETRGEAAFAMFREPGSRWRQGEAYLFVLDPAGSMVVHPDPGLEGKNQLDLKDVSGRPIIRGLIDAATALPEKPEGWYLSLIAIASPHSRAQFSHSAYIAGESSAFLPRWTRWISSEPRRSE